MVNTTVSIPGQIGNAGSDTALLLKVFSGEVLKTFRENFKYAGWTRSKGIGAGRSHQFPVLGQADAAHYARGENMLDPANGYLNNIEGGERTIQVDRPLVSPIVVEDWDSKLAHFEFREEYAAQLGIAIARKLNAQVAQTIALTARSAATLTATQASTKNGQVIPKAASDTSATAMIEAMIDAAVGFENRDVPMEELHFAVRPAMWYKLIEEGSLINRDFNPDGNGSKSEAVLQHGYGFMIHKDRFIPSTVVTAAAGENNNYAGDFSKTQALAWHKDAVGTVYRTDIGVRTQEKLEYDGDLVVAKMICGTGVLRPECAAEIVIP